MKVILVKDVARLGRKSEVKDVPSGHALNFLIPKKLAIIATPESIKRHDEEVKKHSAQKEHDLKSFEDALHALAAHPIAYHTEANAQGHLFKGINADDIAHRLEEEHIAITKNHIVLEHAIKEVGTHEIALAHGEKKGTFVLEVIAK